MTIRTVALLGTGIMGAPMARNLAKAGFRVRVWNRTRAKADALADVAEVAGTPQLAVAGADAVVTMLENGAVVTEVVLGGRLAEHAAGALFIDMSSIQPQLARDHAQALGAAGCRHLDAPVSGGEVGAVEARLAIMAGGSADDFAAALPLFSAMGRATHVGPSGAGQTAKLANQVIVGITIGAVSEALTLAVAGGCDAAQVQAALMGGFATSRILELHGGRMIAGDFRPGAMARVQLKDMDNALDAARRAGLRLPLTETARGAYAALTNELGMAEKDHSAYHLWLKALNAGR
ncbi:NAD(P)-dependent oxidoreductase [Limibaculum sp. FT325]|uniref:NAD(P)-dependent oxidoreductase n=1 Tax=Thermohalobaculum sediminis TaxID=2939436 RepID=UPI0020BED594|nr:NAD(P)-dependent oxidoreductase [Limibaculum sediminis]MCL5775646.1 NAD(P)-dependent oxidoreductase [Limibaculum sediminis]